MASLGVRSFARDAALIAGAATVSTLVSATVMPLVALVQRWVRELLSLNSPYAKFIFDFTWGGIVGSTVKVLTAPFNVVSETHQYLTIRSYVCDVPPPGTLVDQCFSMYESGFLANAIIDTQVNILRYTCSGPPACVAGNAYAESRVCFAGHRYFPTQFVNFAMKDRIKRLIPRFDPKVAFWKFFAANMASGGLAGAMSLMVVYPLDLARTRLLLKRLEDPGAPPFSISAVRDELRLIVRESGYTGLYTGFTVSVLGIVAYRGPYFLLYDFLKQANPWKKEKGSKGLASKFVIAQGTAVFAGLISLPQDVIRRGSIFAPELTILEVITRIFERAGPLGFFTGFGLNAVRTIVGALAIVMHDEARAMLK